MYASMQAANRQYEAANRLGDTASAVTSSEVADELARLDNNVSIIEQCIQALNVRLSAVLRPIPLATQKADQVGGGLSPMGGAVRSASDRLQAAQHQLGCLLEALAV